MADHPAPDTYVVASGFGDRAQWFRNIQTDPLVRVTIGTHRPAPAAARVLPQNEPDATLHNYISRHPCTRERFQSILENTLGTPIAEQNAPLPMAGLHLDH
ncbi:nitroreductase family deazaflavin-dependent oxidoreductase [Streptomyces sirii]|uniref:nitroreductase family deazaflavin-dependent oxidoreductase n=1 Tax=Streptomyces sirii TaxID=3127701 RepID=UPI003D35B9E5